MDRVFLEAARKIEACSNIDRVWQIYVDAIAPFDITNAVYLMVPDNPPADPFVMSNLPNNWPAALMQNPDFQEPFLTFCCATFEITKIGAEFLPDHDGYLSETNKQYIREALQFNWRAGLGIPCQLVGSGRHGGFLVGNGLDGFTFERKILPLSNMLQSLSLITHRRIETIRNGDMETEAQKPLSARERQTLDLISKGFRPKQIAHELGLSEAAIRLYLKNARTKLGANTKEEAIAIFQNQDA